MQILEKNSLARTFHKFFSNFSLAKDFSLSLKLSAVSEKSFL